MTPTPEAIEAAARAAFDSFYNEQYCDNPGELESTWDVCKEAYIRRQQAALSAALPHIEKQIRERCAAIADNRELGAASGWNEEQVEWWETGCVDMQRAIAAAIRKGE